MTLVSPTDTRPDAPGGVTAEAVAAVPGPEADPAAGPGLVPPTSAEAVMANAVALVPLIAEEADGIEAAGRLTPRAERAMREAGVFEMGFPRSRGGLEMTLAQQVEVVALLASVDASAAWNEGVLNAGGYYAGRLDDAAYAALYPTRDRPTSGSFHPRGRAERVAGGYLVSGRWDWARHLGVAVDGAGAT